MPIPGAHDGSQVGPQLGIRFIISNGGSSLYTMLALNTGCCFRFKALDTTDIKSVRLSWSSVSAPGTIQLRIETIDATTGKPTGTLYDANATFDITPAVGIQTYTFATLPTTGLTIGTEYAIVLLTTVAGTTQTLHHSATINNFSNYPNIVLTAADGTTRANFAELAASIPIVSLVDENDVEISDGFLPFSGASATISYVYSTTAFAAQKITTGADIKIAGITAVIRRTGTPAGDLRVRIFDSSNNVISGTTISVDMDSLTGVSTRMCTFLFPTIVTLSAGTYRIVFDSASSVSSANAFGIYSCTFMNSACVSPLRLSTSTDGTTWSDSTTQQVGVWLLLDDFVAGAGGGGEGPLIGGRLIGR